jgi:hypothetical protein
MKESLMELGPHLNTIALHFHHIVNAMGTCFDDSKVTAVVL